MISVMDDVVDRFADQVVGAVLQEVRDVIGHVFCFALRVDDEEKSVERFQ